MSGVVASDGGHRSHTSIPVLHAGSHFRHGLLQLMIHTIDPLHDGKFPRLRPFNFNFLIYYLNPISTYILLEVLVMFINRKYF